MLRPAALMLHVDGSQASRCLRHLVHAPQPTRSGAVSSRLMSRCVAAANVQQHAQPTTFLSVLQWWEERKIVLLSNWLQLLYW